MNELTTRPCKHQFGHRRLRDGSLQDHGPRKCAICGEQEVLAPQAAILEMRREEMENGFGPAMLALTDMQQRFVIAFLDFGTGNATDAARKAGYCPIGDTEDRREASMRAAGSRISRTDKVLAAIQEEGRKRITGMVPMALVQLQHQLMGGGDGKGTRWAIERIFNRAGLIEKTEHVVTVQHTTDDEKIDRIKRLALETGIDPAKLLGMAGRVIDVTPEEPT